MWRPCRDEGDGVSPRRCRVTAMTFRGTSKIETGYTLQVPAFVQVGDKIRVSTEDGQYVERA